jgi:hypothetical protein
LQRNGGNSQRLADRNFQRSYIARYLGSDFIFGNFKVKPSLEIHPKNWGIAEVARKAKGCIRRDTPPLVNDVGNPCHGNAQIRRHPVHSQLEGNHELFAQDLARMNWFGLLSHGINILR